MIFLKLLGKRYSKLVLFLMCYNLGSLFSLPIFILQSHLTQRKSPAKYRNMEVLYQVFDRAALLKRVAGNSTLADKLVRHFLEDTPSQLSTLRKHLDERDAPAARMQAHKLKGAAATLSANSLRDLAYQAELAAKAGELIQLAQAFLLDIGELEALKLMQQSPGAILLTDDAAARLVAERLGYEVHGTIGVVVRAFRRQQRTKRQVLNVLRSLPRRSTCFVGRRLLNSIIDLGVNLIDTAPAYDLSEERIGKGLAHRRGEFVLSTKVGEIFERGESRYDFSAVGVRYAGSRSTRTSGARRSTFTLRTRSRRRPFRPPASRRNTAASAAASST
jgi:HPt (histidine-containing phosphotransfer) domain-containing protein